MIVDVDLGREVSIIEISTSDPTMGTSGSVCLWSVFSYCTSIAHLGHTINTTNLSSIHNLQRQSKMGWVERIGADTCSSISVWGDPVA